MIRKQNVPAVFSLAIVGMMLLALAVVKLGPYWRPARVVSARVTAGWSGITGGDGASLEKIVLADAYYPAHPYQKEYNFTSDWFTPHIPIWEKVLSPLKGKPDIRYLEIGVFEGRSSLWIAENILTHPSSHLTVIDPFPLTLPPKTGPW